MWDPDPHRRRMGLRLDILKTEHLLGIEARSCELSAPAFRFLSLPAELRYQVYSCHFANTKKKPYYDLARFRNPAITLVSKQTRREAQPIFFGECSFMFWAGVSPFELAGKNRAGCPGLTPRVHRCLTAAGDAALFRHLYIQVVGPFLHKLPRIWVCCKMATIEIQTEPKLEYSCTRSPGPLISRNSEALAPAAAALKDAQIVVEKLSASEEFNGYSLNDLTQIAKVFFVTE